VLTQMAEPSTKQVVMDVEEPGGHFGRAQDHPALDEMPAFVAWQRGVAELPWKRCRPPSPPRRTGKPPHRSSRRSCDRAC